MSSTVPRPSNPLLIRAVIGFGILLFLALPVGLIVGGLQAKPQVEAIPGGVKSTGTIESVDARSALHGRLYTPTIAFTDTHGHVHLFDGPSESTSPKVGDHVSVSYDPDNPDRAADLSAGSLTWEFPFWSGVVVAVLEVAAAAWVIKRRRAMKHAAVTA